MMSIYSHDVNVSPRHYGWALRGWSLGWTLGWTFNVLSARCADPIRDDCHRRIHSIWVAYQYDVVVQFHSNECLFYTFGLSLNAWVTRALEHPLHAKRTWKRQECRRCHMQHWITWRTLVDLSAWSECSKQEPCYDWGTPPMRLCRFKASAFASVYSPTDQASVQTSDAPHARTSQQQANCAANLTTQYRPFCTHIPKTTSHSNHLGYALALPPIINSEETLW